MQVYVPISMVKLANESPMVQRQRRLVERNINEYTLRFLVHWRALSCSDDCPATGCDSLQERLRLRCLPSARRVRARPAAATRSLQRPRLTRSLLTMRRLHLHFA